MPAIGSCCKCGECHITDTACDACAKCIPRYFCVTATPSDYHSCLKPFVFRMQVECSGDTYVWAGGKQLSDELSVSAISVLYKDVDEYGNVTCRTTVQGTEGVVEYPGAFPAGMATQFIYAKDTPNEIAWDLTFSAGGGSTNHKVHNRCAKCACASCVPVALCLKMTLVGFSVAGFPCGATYKSTTLSYSCGAYTGAPIVHGDREYVARVDLQDDFCGAIFTLTGGDTDYVKEINFESLNKLCDDPAVSNAFWCREEVPDSTPVTYTSTHKTNAPAGCLTESKYNVMISDSGILEDYHGDLLASFILEERFCGGLCEPDASTQCVRACPVLDERPLMCSPISIYASILEDDCSHSPSVFELKQTGSYTPGALSFPSGACQRYGNSAFALSCDAGSGYTIEMILYYVTNVNCPDTTTTDMDGYRLRVRVGGVPCDIAGEPATDVTLSPEPGAVCESFQLDFKVPILGACSPIPCCYGTGLTEMTIRVTL